MLFRSRARSPAGGAGSPRAARGPVGALGRTVSASEEPATSSATTGTAPARHLCRRRAGSPAAGARAETASCPGLSPEDAPRPTPIPVCHLFGGHSCLQMRGQVFPEGLLRHLTVPEQILNISSKQGKERMNFHAFLQEVFGNSRCSIRSLTNAKVHICLSVNPEAAPWVGPSPAPPSSPGHSRCWFSLAPSRLCSEESTA